jgi:hypothetical protein
MQDIFRNCIYFLAIHVALTLTEIRCFVCVWKDKDIIWRHAGSFVSVLMFHEAVLGRHSELYRMTRQNTDKPPIFMTTKIISIKCEKKLVTDLDLFLKLYIQILSQLKSKRYETAQP